MNEMVGIFFITTIAIIIFFAGKKYPEINKLIWIAFLIRLFFLFLQHFFPLPDSGLDAKTFEIMAYNFSQSNYEYSIVSYDPSLNDYGTYRFYPWLLSNLYLITGRSYILAQSVSLFFGLSSLFLLWKSALYLWGSLSAKRILLIATVFPIHILYSVLPMRETFIYFGLILVVYFLIRSRQNSKILNHFMIYFGLFFASAFHGAILLMVAPILLFQIYILIKKFFNKISIFKFTSLLVIISSVLLVLIYPKIKNFEIPYIGSLEQVDFEYFQFKLKDRYASDADSQFPEYLIPNTPSEAVLLSPVQISYFLYSPFIWDITKLRHLFGYFDSLIYIAISIMILASFKEIYTNKTAFMILVLVISLIVLYAYGTVTFGSGIRHRAKLFYLMLILAGPMISKFSIKKFK